jgi:hypothetical protein
MEIQQYHAVTFTIDANITTTLQNWFTANPGAIVVSTDVLSSTSLLVIYSGRK